MKQPFDVVVSIKEIIKNSGMHQKFVAKKAGFTEQQFSDMLNGRKVIRAEYLPAIASALNVSVADLYSANAS